MSEINGKVEFSRYFSEQTLAFLHLPASPTDLIPGSFQSTRRPIDSIHFSQSFWEQDSSVRACICGIVWGGAGEAGFMLHKEK